MKSGIIGAGKVSGARNPFGKKADEHAERYYGLVRSMQTDVAKIAATTGILKDDIRAVKEYIFLEKHDLGNGYLEYFAPDYMMAESWQRLIDGKPETHDLVLLQHELMERDLIKRGYSQADAHRLASSKYDYGEEAGKYYAKIKKYRKE